jgi:hypothetical protein
MNTLIFRSALVAMLVAIGPSLRAADDDAGPPPTDREVLEKDGFKCERAGVDSHICSKDGERDRICDNSGECTTLRSRRGPTKVAPPLQPAKR